MEQGLVPDALKLVESFLNSADRDSGRDDLDSLPRFRSWLSLHHRELAGDTANAADLELARELRFALRGRAATHHGGGASDDAWLDELTRAIPLCARVTPRGIGLGPADTGVRGVLGEILAAIVLAAHDGSWRRLKICRADGCQVAYYDRSKNASRCWCSMEICGNRSKTKAYRGRRRETSWQPVPTYPEPPAPAYPPDERSAYPPEERPAYPPDERSAYPPEERPAYPPDERSAYPREAGVGVAAAYVTHPADRSRLGPSLGGIVAVEQRRRTYE